MKQVSIPFRGPVLGLSLLLASCGGGGGSSPFSEGPAEENPPSNEEPSNEEPSPEQPTGATITAYFVKGPVSGASCTLYAVTSGGAQGEQLATGTTEAGVVSFSNVDYSGRTLAVCSGGTYTDEASGETRSAPQMRSVADLSGEDAELSVTPLTEIAVASAAGDFSAVDNAAVAQAFGLGETDISAVNPTDLNSGAAADDDAGRYGTALALISQLQEDREQTLAELLSELGEEMEDGALAEQDQSDLSQAASNLADSPVADSLDSNVTQTIVDDIDEQIDDTPPSIAFIPGSATMEYGSSASVEIMITDGHLQGDVSCTGDVSYSEGSLSSGTQLGEFSCSASAIDRNQNTAEASITINVVDTTDPVISAPESVSFVSGETGQAEISAIDGFDGELDFTMSCTGENAVFYEGAFFSQMPGNYVCTVSASDSQGNNATTDIAIAVIEEILNTAPLASAGDDFAAPTGSRVELDASQSSDEESSVLSFTWSVASAPTASSANIENSSSAQASFMPDVDGAYVLNVNVSDGDLSANDSLTLTASTGTWLLNENFEEAAYINALVNVIAVTEVSVAMTPFYQVATSGVPNYSVEMTQAHIDALNSRPQAGDDFDLGETSAMVGDIIAFGQDIGYKITHQGCELGYWPPGPACPSEQQRAANIPAEPSPASEDCETSINTMGLMLNGTSVYNWSDGVSYNNQGVWNQLAPEFEIYDVDICAGHAQTQGDYHHHMFSPCLASLFGDEGQAHSPIYGYAADGYPIYGPWNAKGVLAKSSWVKRDYSDMSAGGCSDGQRSCILADQYDLSQGVIVLDAAGPDTDEVVISNSGNEFMVESGYYFEDYYYDSSLVSQGSEYLDEHNGHDHDGLGYHYHSTAESVAGALVPSFPYNIGPTFYGDTPGGSLYSCSAPRGPMP